MIGILFFFSPEGSCGTLPHPENGMVRFTSMLLGGHATFVCDPGYMLDGSYLRTCGVLGTWSGSSPTCQRKTQQCLPSLSSPSFSHFVCFVYFPRFTSILAFSPSQPSGALNSVTPATEQSPQPIPTCSSLWLTTAATLATACWDRRLVSVRPPVSGLEGLQDALVSGKGPRGQKS